MNELKFKQTKIMVRQLLLTFIDVNRAILPLFDKRNIYRIPFKAYDKFRENDKESFRLELYRLQQEKIIKKYFDGKEEFIEISIKGKKRLKKYVIDQLDIKQPKVWDKKWHIVIFDIPNSKNKSRDTLRHKLIEIGFIELQESVYVFPFDCRSEIIFLKNLLYLNPYVQYIIADRIETEVDLIKIFLNKEILNDKLIK